MPRPRKEQSTLDDAIRHAAEAGFEPPFVPGSPRPQMRAPSVPVKTEDGKFNADWFAEILSNLHEYQTQFWNYWGKSWPDYRDQVDTIIKQATTCGIDLARYAPEQFTLSQIQSVDDLMAATDSMLEKLEEQLQSCTLRALQLVPDAKKKSWLSVLRRTRRAHRLCRDSIPTDVVEANPGRDDVFEAWALTRSLRFMLWCQRTTIGTTDGTESLVMLPDHLLVAGVTIALARQMRHAGADIQGVVVTIAPRHGKPVHEDSLVLMGDGSRKRIADVRVGDMVISHTGNPRKVLAVHEQGELPLVEIVADSDRITKAAPDHPFLTAGGWVEAGKLRPGMSLALVPSPRTEPTDGRSEDEYRLAGYLVGDGCVVAHNGSHECSITCADPVQIEDIVRCANAIGFGTKIVKTKSAASLVRIRGAIPWLKETGLAGKGSWTKRVPEFVYRGSARNIAAYVGAYFACDGTVNQRGKARTDCCVEFYSVSRELLSDTQHLLLRLGIKSGIRLKNGRMPDKTPHKSFRLSFASINEVQKFKDAVPIASVKAKRLFEWTTNRSDFGNSLLPDMVKEVRDGGTGRCLCLTVDVDSTFTSDDFVVHNSWLVCADEALSLSEDPWNPHGFVHRKREIAQQRVSMVKDWFDEEKGLGRRRAALFPRVRIDAAKSRGKGSLWLLLDGESVCTHAEGNLAAHGIHSGAQGITLTEIKFDDPVDEKDRNEAGTRERTNAAFQQTWLNRLTGRKSFFVMVATCWHPDDVTGSLVKMVRAGAIRAAVVNIPCGGPHDGFRPLWPEVGYDSEFLRRRFMRLGAPAYSCIYQNEPDTIEGRRISKLHFFDQRMIDDKSARTPEWSRFLDDPATLRFLSIDPSGSGARTSNKAGIGYFAFGEMRTTDENGAPAVLPRLVMLRAWSIHASQHALVDVVVKFIASGQRVDRILVETTGGYHATAEQLVREGIPSATVWRVAPGTGTKVDRLLKYAIHVENGDIAFPGRWTTDEHGDPTLEISPEFASVGEQLLRAGTTVDDEQLDVVRQALSQHSMEFDAAHGWTQARGSGRATGDPMSDGISKLFAAATSRPDRSSRSAMSFITRKQAFR